MSPKRVGILQHRHTDTQTCGLINQTCIIALATARPGTTIVISCAGTRDSDRLAPWEWAAGCMAQPVNSPCVCWVGQPCCPLGWLPGLFDRGRYRASGTKPHHTPAHHTRPDPPCLLLLGLILAVGREEGEENTPTPREGGGTAVSSC